MLDFLEIKRKIIIASEEITRLIQKEGLLQIFLQTGNVEKKPHIPLYPVYSQLQLKHQVRKNTNSEIVIRLGNTKICAQAKKLLEKTADLGAKGQVLGDSVQNRDKIDEPCLMTDY